MSNLSEHNIIEIKRDSTGRIIENSSNFNLPENFVCPSGLDHWFMKIDNKVYRVSLSINVDNSESIILVDCSVLHGNVNLFKELFKEYQALFEKYKMLSEIDALTNVLNKRGFSSKMQLVLPNTRSTYLAILDINDFKSINSDIGHIEADKLLKQTCDIINSFLGEDDFLGRFGGDEFVLAFPKSSIQEITNKLYSQIIPALKNIGITFCMGISEYPSNTSYNVEKHSEVLKNADKALYKSKNMLENCQLGQKFSCVNIGLATIDISSVDSPNDEYR